MSDLTSPAVRAEPVEARPSTSLRTNGGGAAASPDQKKLRAVAEQFEAVMLRQVMGSMRAASLGDGIFDSSSTEQFRDMSDAKVAESMAHQGALHIADLLVKQYGATLGGSAASASSAK